MSGTAVRESIKADDKKKFESLMPKGTSAMFDEFKEAISQVKESMKDLENYIRIYEAKHHVDTAQVKDFYQWACAGEMPDGKAEKDIINADDCEGLLDNGWFDNFKDTKEIANWFNKNWEEQIKVKSDETSNDWEISFKLGKDEFVAAFQTYFGGEFEE